MNFTGLNVNDRVQVITNCPYEAPVTWSNGNNGIGYVPASRNLTATFNQTPSYFDFFYTVLVTPSDGNAPYSISNDEAEPIGYPDFGNGTAVSVDCKNPNTQTEEKEDGE